MSLALASVDVRVKSPVIVWLPLSKRIVPLASGNVIVLSAVGSVATTKVSCSSVVAPSKDKLALFFNCKVSLKILTLPKAISIYP